MKMVDSSKGKDNSIDSYLIACLNIWHETYVESGSIVSKKWFSKVIQCNWEVNSFYINFLIFFPLLLVLVSFMNIFPFSNHLRKDALETKHIKWLKSNKHCRNQSNSISGKSCSALLYFHISENKQKQHVFPASVSVDNRSIFYFYILISMFLTFIILIIDDDNNNKNNKHKIEKMRKWQTIVW